MTEFNETSDAAKFELKITLSEDKRAAQVEMTNSDSVTYNFIANTETVDVILNQIGIARSSMLDAVPNDLSFGEFHPLTAYDPRWYVSPDSTNQYATFWIRHSGYGWAGYGFPRYEAATIAKALRKVTSVVSTQSTQSPSATSFGGDHFLITTEGLGFYYYGKGDKRIGPNPFEQIEFDSDRAAGIVAGSIAEKRLEQALKAIMRDDNPDASQNLFRPSGPLGPFSTKIDLAHLLKLLSNDAYHDLRIIKNIRNDFAHHVELDSFDLPTIKDRCNNLILVDRHIGPVPDSLAVGAGAALDQERPRIYRGLPDYKERLADPRFRYVMTTQIISYLLGEGSDQECVQLPFI